MDEWRGSGDLHPLRLAALYRLGDPNVKPEHSHADHERMMEKRRALEEFARRAALEAKAMAVPVEPMRPNRHQRRAAAKLKRTGRL
jgi:hypothetical protein